MRFLTLAVSRSARASCERGLHVDLLGQKVRHVGARDEAGPPVARIDVHDPCPTCPRTDAGERAISAVSNTLQSDYRFPFRNPRIMSADVGLC